MIDTALLFAVGIPKTATSARATAVPHGADQGCGAPCPTDGHAADGDRAAAAKHGRWRPR